MPLTTYNFSDDRSIVKLRWDKRLKIVFLKQLQSCDKLKLLIGKIKEDKVSRKKCAHEAYA